MVVASWKILELHQAVLWYWQPRDHRTVLLPANCPHKTARHNLLTLLPLSGETCEHKASVLSHGSEWDDLGFPRALLAMAAVC